MFDEYKNHDVAVYAGYLDDTAKLLQSSSGGIATALAEYMLSQGGHVAGVSYSKDLYRAEYILIHDLADVDRLKGTKYIECDKKSIYSDVKALLAAGEKVLFFGLPCVTAALYSFLGSRPQNLLTCELVCFGPMSSRVHEEYLTYLEKNYGGKVVDFSVRYKKDAWQPPYLYAKFDNGKVFKKPFYQTEYGYAFSVFGRESCYHCHFKGNDRQGDIMLGDFWGAGEDDVFWNKYGVSCIFAQTDAGNAFVQAVPGISLFPTTFERAVERNPMVIRSKTKHADHDAFAALLPEKGLLYAVRHAISPKFKMENRLDFLVTEVSRHVPKSIKSFVKKVYHTVKK